MQEDTRLVQTAVLGNEDSWDPAILPDDWREARQLADGFKRAGLWCGNVLGGCGEPLTTKVGTIRIPHFSHFPDPERLPCGRRYTGRDSADHLFINRDFTTWLKEHGHQLDDPSFKGDFRNGGRCEGVTIRSRGGEGVVSVVLADLPPSAWDEADHELRASYRWVRWFFGPGIPFPQSLLIRDGYILRIKCEDLGPTRTARVGTQRVYGRTAWISLSECELTGDGIWTPLALEARKQGATRRTTTSSPQKRQQQSPGDKSPGSPRIKTLVNTLIGQALAACRKTDTRRARQHYDEALRLVKASGIKDAFILNSLHECVNTIQEIEQKIRADITQSKPRRLPAPRAQQPNHRNPRHRGQALSGAQVRDYEERLDLLIKTIASPGLRSDPGKLLTEAEYILQKFPPSSYRVARQRIAQLRRETNEASHVRNAGLRLYRDHFPIASINELMGPKGAILGYSDQWWDTNNIEGVAKAVRYLLVQAARIEKTVKVQTASRILAIPLYMKPGELNNLFLSVDKTSSPAEPPLAALLVSSKGRMHISYVAALRATGDLLSDSEDAIKQKWVRRVLWAFSYWRRAK